MNSAFDSTRLQKIIAYYTKYSRRKAEQLIVQGAVKVNGLVVTQLGVKASYDDQIMIKNHLITKKRVNSYIIMHKPCFTICTSHDPQKRTTVIQLLKEKYYPPLYSVGRLDYHTSGLLLLTNDGQFCYRITHPKQEIPKTYIVTLNQKPSDHHLHQLEQGIDIGNGEKTKPAIVQKWNEGKLFQIKITISQGYNRQIRRMFAQFNYKVVGLHRIQIGNLKLPSNLKPGEYRQLTAAMSRLIWLETKEFNTNESRD